MKKLSLLAALVLTSTAATADPIFLDVGKDFGANNFNKVGGVTTTGWLNELSFKYESDSVITDEDGDFTLSAGDTIKSSGGVLRNDFATDHPGFLSGLAENHFTSLLPGQIGGESHNGFDAANGSNWGMTLGFTNVEGVFNADNTITYNSGQISIYYFDADPSLPSGVSDLVRLFDFDLSTGADGYNGVVGTGLVGDINNSNMTECVNGVALTDASCVLAGDVLNVAYRSGSLTGSEAEARAAADPSFQFGSFVITNTEQIGNVSFNPQGQFLISGSHDGSITFNVPEPGTLGLFGLALLGVAGAARRKS
ncbi:PEP-CTERM sorting domain-containing protein [Psychrosphaera sp.]|nr:PEP-CTERM sorting domain-containing protein [Psychrosphaera sp.]